MKYIEADGSIIYKGTLEENRAEALFAISSNFADLARTNSFMCSFGYPIDNRWIDKNDLDNMTCSIESWFEIMPIVAYRDSEDISHFILRDDLIKIKKEAQQNRIWKFTAKWLREQMVMVAVDVVSIWGIIEASDEWVCQQNGMD